MEEGGDTVEVLAVVPFTVSEIYIEKRKSREIYEMWETNLYILAAFLVVLSGSDERRPDLRHDES